MAQVEFDYFIPASVIVSADGSIPDMTYVYSFDDRDTFFLYDFTGWGMPSIDYITQQGTYQHGQTVLDYRLQPRTIQLTHRKLGNCRQNYWDNRYMLVDRLRPNFQLANTFEPGRLRKILPDGSIRDIRVLIEQGPAFAPRSVDSWDEYAFTETLRFIAHNPIIFNPAVNTASWVLGSLDNLIFWEFTTWDNRLVFEGDDLDSGGIWFGEGSIGDIINVNYTGTWLSYPTIIITGPINVPSITNNTTSETIELNYNVAPGEVVTINLEYGQKTVTNQLGTNLIGTVTTTSDLATFHIAPNPEAPLGVNQLVAYGDAAVLGQTEVRIEWYTQYIGI